MARINIPTNPDDLIKLARGIVDKHKADGTASPLSALDMAGMEAKTNAAETQNQDSVRFYRDAEKATQARDLALGNGNAVEGTVLNYVRSARDVLSGIYKGKEQKLGDWSFDVSQSAASNGKPVATPASK